MTSQENISTYISRLSVSLLLLLVAVPSMAQLKMFRMENDSIPLFRGFSVSFDVVGAAMLAFSDHGEIGGALRINLHDQWFPVFEMGIGRANHEKDVVTSITYKTSAPYFRIGMDWNILRNKHQSNRLYAGLRYAFTSYKVDVIRDQLPDPVWQSKAGFGVEGLSCSMHWAEIVVGIDTRIFGPFHLGWDVRYRRRLVHKEGDLGNTWYVPGFGINDQDKLAANFNVIIDI
ncbi:MAG: hypothetical protein J6M01_01050 [Prevotella sp.]|nr:hypothetical protein [Prevotella sp.]